MPAAEWEELIQPGQFPSPPARSLRRHEERSQPPRPGVGYRFGRETFAGTTRNGQDAPKADALTELKPVKNAFTKTSEETYSITSSARAIAAGGKVKSMAPAVLRLIPKTNRLACSVGISPGFTPWRIFAT